MFLKIIILLALVVAFLWLLRSLGSESKRKRSGASRRRAHAEDMRQCRVCGTYVPSVRPQSCGRPDCPFPGRRG